MCALFLITSYLIYLTMNSCNVTPYLRTDAMGDGPHKIDSFVGDNFFITITKKCYHLLRHDCEKTEYDRLV